MSLRNFFFINLLIITVCILDIHSTLTKTALAQNQIYYVASVSCDDTGLGNYDVPFCSLSEAVSHLQAGDHLIIRNGLYTRQGLIEGLSGTATEPIVIEGETRNGVIIDGGCQVYPCEFSTVNFEGDQETGQLQINTSSHLVIRNLTIQNTIGSGISVLNGENIQLEQLTIVSTGNSGILVKDSQVIGIQHNNLQHIQQGFIYENEIFSGSHEAITLAYVEDFVVAHNKLVDILKEGIDAKESSLNGQIHHNMMQYICSVGIYINESSNIKVFANRIVDTGYLLIDSKTVPCGNHPVYGEMLGEFYGTGILLAIGDLGDLSTGQLDTIDIYQNEIWHTFNNGIELWNEWQESGNGTGVMTNLRIFNNTVYDCGLGGIRVADVGGAWLANNIIALCAENTITGSALSETTITHNLFVLNDNQQSAYGESSLVLNPLFLNAEKGIFQLEASSSAIDSGIETELPYLGTAPDIGAYEYNPS